MEGIYITHRSGELLTGFVISYTNRGGSRYLCSAFTACTRPFIITHVAECRGLFDDQLTFIDATNRLEN